MKHSNQDSISVLYEDEHLLAVNKPPNLFVHPTNLDRSEVDTLLTRLNTQTGLDLSPVHRLDKPTSGVLLLAKHAEAVRVMSERFSVNNVDKRYLALVRGFLPIYGEVSSPLKHRTKEQIQDAMTLWRRICQGHLNMPTPPHPTSRFSLIELQPKTGRWHQLRRHCAHIRHPIIGDTSHGDGHQNRILRHFLAPCLFLHAHSIAFQHPLLDEQMITITAPTPSWISDLDKIFQWGAFPSLYSTAKSIWQAEGSEKQTQLLSKSRRA